jgi:hypothetical protein
MAQAYDFALEKIGYDVNAYSVWSDYVDFLDNVVPMGQQAEMQKIAAIRNVCNCSSFPIHSKKSRTNKSDLSLFRDSHRL